MCTKISHYMPPGRTSCLCGVIQDGEYDESRSPYKDMTIEESIFGKREEIEKTDEV